MRRAEGFASPSLALAKYWGKTDGSAAQDNIAITLTGMQTHSIVQLYEQGEQGYGRDRVVVNGMEQNTERYRDFLQHAQNYFDAPCTIQLESHNNFPTASGLASSSSGFAAASIAIAACASPSLSMAEVSALARSGSVSAARAVFGGFVYLRAGAEHAERFYPAEHWPELSIIVACVEGGAKPISSRDAMKHCQATSPFYASWVEDSQSIAEQVSHAIMHRDISTLGGAMRRSYLRMFSTMFSADPPIMYWTAESLRLLHSAESLRSRKLPVWETMDAGPQVKFLTLEQHRAEIEVFLREQHPLVEFRHCKIGEDAYAKT